MKDKIEEAAEKHPLYETYYDEHKETFIEGFKAGAEWMAKQGVNAKRTIIKFPDGRGYLADGLSYLEETKYMEHALGNFKSGEKVIVQIRKEK